MEKIFTPVTVTTVAVTALLFVPAALMAQCCGDCNGDGTVTVDEILTSVNHALTGCSDDGICSTASCPSQLATVSNFEQCSSIQARFGNSARKC
jgi:hypothetical protein